MTAVMYLIVAILVLTVILGIIAYKLRKKEKKPIDYYTFFVMGLIWLPFGIVTKNYALGVMGLVFMIYGLRHKEKWKENRKNFDHLDPQKKKIVMGALILGLVVLLAAVYVTYIMR